MHQTGYGAVLALLAAMTIASRARESAYTT